MIGKFVQLLNLLLPAMFQNTYPNELKLSQQSTTNDYSYFIKALNEQNEIIEILLNKVSTLNRRRFDVSNKTDY